MIGVSMRVTPKRFFGNATNEVCYVGDQSTLTFRSGPHSAHTSNVIPIELYTQHF